MIQLLFCLSLAFSSEPNWSEGTPYPPGGISNPYSVDKYQLPELIRSGRRHALQYPVEVSGVLLPYEPIKRFADDDTRGIFQKLIEKIFRIVTKVSSFDELMDWVGLHEYPDEEGDGAYFIPYADGAKPTVRMGETVFDTHMGKAFTISCAECHSADLFGKKIMGLQNRFPRANQFVIFGTKGLKASNPKIFQATTNATDGEKDMFKRARANSFFIESREPQVLGLDTSLAHVALSLARRAKDEYATKDSAYANSPHPEPLKRIASDSKPGVWWNVKYKNRWLLDGSVVAGNPIFTNLLWNEIGRGTDLRELETWLDQNPGVVKELTTAVFSAEAPHITDFFDRLQFDVNSAQRGEVLFNKACARCHGRYEKDRSTLKNTNVIYLAQTPVVDVGTDPLRYQAMESLLQLNNLAISKKNGILIKKQKGYVPPPLVGIWARWPYFHNNSAPSLCAVLTRADERPKTYWAGEASDPATDFDLECNGYPVNVPEEWKENKEAFFNSRKEGLSNTGHDENIFIKDGNEIFSDEQKMDIIRYIQTL